ncbi:hypothetical protein RB195_007589 [Necator americanus]|uniref:Uncharacterized protein n=1 Tax=Necator americanus TaxID=51031 RepID=A0ABR1C1R6_NECAM
MKSGLYHSTIKENQATDPESNQTEPLEERFHNAAKTLHSCCIHGIPCHKGLLRLSKDNRNNHGNLKLIFFPKFSSTIDNSIHAKKDTPQLFYSHDQKGFVEDKTEKPSQNAEISTFSLAPPNPLMHYIGIMTSAEAEKTVPRPTSFRLYHRTKMSLSEMREALRDGSHNTVSLVLPLFVIYRCSEGHIWHYEIIEVQSNSTRLYTVNVPNVTQPCFVTINGLVRFYSNFSLSNHYNEKGELQVDVFPCR